MIKQKFLQWNSILHLMYYQAFTVTSHSHHSEAKTKILDVNQQEVMRTHLSHIPLLSNTYWIRGLKMWSHVEPYKFFHLFHILNFQTQKAIIMLLPQSNRLTKVWVRTSVRRIQLWPSQQLDTKSNSAGECRFGIPFSVWPKERSHMVQVYYHSTRYNVSDFLCSKVSDQLHYLTDTCAFLASHQSNEQTS